MDTHHQLIRFLRDDLDIPDALIPEVACACELTLRRLPVVLWQRRLVNFIQLDQVFQWVETVAER